MQKIIIRTESLTYLSKMCKNLRNVKIADYFQPYPLQMKTKCKVVFCF